MPDLFEEKYRPVDIFDKIPGMRSINYIFNFGTGFIKVDPTSQKIVLAYSKNVYGDNYNKHIWTVVEDDGIMVIVTGLRFCDGMLYCITETPWEDENEFYEY